MKPSIHQHQVNCSLGITDHSACSKTVCFHGQGKTMAFVPHFQAFSTGHTSSMERDIMEGNSVLHDREGEIPVSQMGWFFLWKPTVLHTQSSVSCDALKAADFSGKCHKCHASANPLTFKVAFCAQRQKSQRDTIFDFGHFKLSKDSLQFYVMTSLIVLFYPNNSTFHLQ